MEGNPRYDYGSPRFKGVGQGSGNVRQLEALARLKNEVGIRLNVEVPPDHEHKVGLCYAEVNDVLV